uniref:RTX toxin-related Ca2+-binding protein n=1 Tax=Adineta vaga TaxID=104782 RepID=G3KGV3_ADIVA|nr:RTX toxin-related Ca2+-binding protein [Adineta vaga]
MLFQCILILLATNLSISTRSIIIYKDTQFISSTNSYLIDMFIVQSRDQCICHCYTNENCATLTFIGINQTCLLYSSQFQIENLQLVTYDMNSLVIILSDRMISTTIQTSSTTSSTSSTSTSTSTTTVTTTRASCGITCIDTTISQLNRVAFYSFDKNLSDSIGNYSMNANFTPNYVKGWIGSAISFTYNNHSFIQTSHIPLDSRSFTIDFWFYVIDLTSFRDLGFGGECESSTNNKCLFLNIRDKHLRIVFFGADTPSTTNLLINQWYHTTFVYDSTINKQSIYLNGILDGNATVSNDFLGTTGLFTIGGAQIGGDSDSFVFYSGYIDHFGISYRIKSPCEIYLNAILYCYFSFDSTSFLNDSGPNYLNSINTNGIPTIGRVNQGIQFSSSLSYITINEVNILSTSNNPFTISMWIKPFNLTGGGTLLHTSTQVNGRIFNNFFVSFSYSFYFIFKAKEIVMPYGVLLRMVRL